MRICLFTAAMAALLTSQAMAAFDLQITELQMGIEYGSDETDDWFEVTNFGTSAWTPADGTLYYDDFPHDPNKADPLVGISSIAPGESVIFVDEFDGDIAFPNINILVWHDVWDTPLTNAGRAIPQVGTYSGSGLSNDSVDGAALYIDTNGDGDPNNLDTADLSQLDSEVYTVPNELPLYQGRTWDPTRDGGNGFWSSENILGVDAGPTDVGLAHVGTPGYLVPEPTSIAMMGLALTALGFRRLK